MLGKAMFLMLFMWSGAALANETNVTIAKNMPHSDINVITQRCQGLPSKNAIRRSYMNKGMEIRPYNNGKDVPRAHNVDDTCEDYAAPLEQQQKLPFTKR